jgi:ubiquinone/menaquinone biosynthesis C-methylase UbiE
MCDAAADSQLAHGNEYAYAQDTFPEFYDLMVASLPPEFEVGVDVSVYQHELELQGPESVAVDLATGSGRVLEGLRRVQTCKTLVGVDHSQAMLDACVKRLQLGSSQDSQIQLVCQSMQTLSLPDLEGKCDAVFVSAGSFHHLTSRQEQTATLRNIRALMKPSAASLAILELLNDEDCLDSDPYDLAKV